MVGLLLGSYYAYSVAITENDIIELSLYTVYGLIGFAIPMILALIFFYRIIRQLRSVSRLYTAVPEIDLFNLDPLYSLSSHTAKTGMIFLLLIYTNILISPESLQLPTAAITATVLSALSFLAFILPLRGINRRLVSEKKKTLRDIHHRIKGAFAKIDLSIDNNDLGQMGEMEKTISILESQKSFISKIPTWPWQPSTMRGFLTAVLLPLAIWIIQQILERVLEL